MESAAKRRKLSYAGDSSSFDQATFTASAFKLQTEELVAEARLDYGAALKDVDGLLKQLREAIESIEPHAPRPIWEATRILEKKSQIVVPYPRPQPPKDALYKLEYAKPSGYNVVGSYASKTMVKAQSDLAVDMVVQMAASMFQPKDYLDMRYFYRRAYFIAHITASLRDQHSSLFHFSFEHLCDNPLLPILSLKPKTLDSENASTQSGSRSYRIRIIPCAPEGLFSTAKLAPTTCCNRPEKEGLDTAAVPTPFYNSTLKAEMTFITYLRVLTKAKMDCPSFPDACVLGRTWLQQRGFGSPVANGGFGHFEWAMVTALLMQVGSSKSKSSLSSSLGSSELFKAVIQFLASTNFVKKPFAFSAKHEPDRLREAGPVMFDPLRDLNILFKMTPWSGAALQRHAKATMTLLNEGAVDRFEPTFITKTDIPFHVFDLIFEVTVGDLGSRFTSLDGQGPVCNFSNELYKTLRKALGDRAQHIHIQLTESSAWKVSSSSPTEESSTVLIGIVFDPANMSRIMEYGPPAEQKKEAARFQTFWGDRAELRRFKDGTILECVEWTRKLPFDICEEIIRYILGRHLRLDSMNLSFHGSELSSLVSISQHDRDAYDSAKRAFQTLETDIRNIDNLPLQVRQLLPVAPELRYSSLEAPALGFNTGILRPMSVNLYFEASSRWPENLVAIQEAKIEFLLDIGKRLTASNDRIVMHLGREDVLLGISNLAYLDIAYPTSAVFRLRVHCDLEESLLERQAKNKSLEQHVRIAAEEALFSFRSLYTHIPLHTQTISTFCTRLPPLSSTIRLTKRWFGSHKLVGLVSEELIELIVLHVFLNPHPWTVPTGAAVGFLRTLHFLSRWDWREEPLIVDFDDSITPSARSEIRSRLEEWRKRDPNMNRQVMIAATPHDQTGLMYTRTGPSKIVATRMTRLAKIACRTVKEQGIELDAKQLFASPLKDYDVVIFLSKKAIEEVLRDSANSAGTRFSQYKNLDERTGRLPEPLALHPVDVLLRVLRHTYKDSLLFFHGGHDDYSIGAIWHPPHGRQKFRTGLPYNFTSAGAVGGEGGEDAVEINQRAILAEIARIGGELIKRIE